MPEETRLFVRSFLFALVVSIVYWFVSYDYIGTVLLGGFSLASLALFTMLRRGEPKHDGARGGALPVQADAREGLLARVGDLVGTTERPGQERPFEDESGRIPTGSAAPLLLGIGIALIALGLIFGLWSIVAGVIPLALGAREWLREVSAELRAVAADDPVEAAAGDQAAR